jgi:hypothetical protein
LFSKITDKQRTRAERRLGGLTAPKDRGRCSEASHDRIKREPSRLNPIGPAGEKPHDFDDGCLFISVTAEPAPKSINVGS